MKREAMREWWHTLPDPVVAISSESLFIACSTTISPAAWEGAGVRKGGEREEEGEKEVYQCCTASPENSWSLRDLQKVYSYHLVGSISKFGRGGKKEQKRGTDEWSGRTWSFALVDFVLPSQLTWKGTWRPFTTNISRWYYDLLS